jgi:hypothetical protein
MYMSTRMATLWMSSTATLFACRGDLAIGGSDDAGHVETDSASISNQSGPGREAGDSDDTGVPGDARTQADAGFPLPVECANPGPFTDQPTATSLPSLLVGTWINCGNSLFTGAGVPIDEVGIVIRADMTWQKQGASEGQLVPLTQHEDHGTWSVYGGGCCGEMALLSWDTDSLASSLLFAADGRSMFVTTPAGGNQATLAKADGTL